MRRYHIVLALTLATGMVLSLAVAGALQYQYARQIQRDFERAARDRAMAVQLGIANGQLIGHSVASLFAASQHVTRAEFAAFSKFILANTAYIRALAWAPRVSLDQRSSFESANRIAVSDVPLTEFSAGGQLVPAGERETYYPMQFIAPYLDSDTPLGFDLGSDTANKVALEYARDHNRPGTTQRVELLQGGGGPGILILVPSYRKQVPLDTVAQRRAALRGVIVLMIDLPALVESSLAHLEPSGISFTLYDDSAPHQQRFLYHHLSRLAPARAESDPPATAATRPVLVYREAFDVNNRRWSLQMQPLPGYFTTAVTLEVWVVFGTILLATLVLAAYLNLLSRRERVLRQDRRQLERLVAERTRDLEEKNQELETFSYSIAHDLRAPLRAISGFSQILMEDSSDKLNAEEKATLERVVKAGHHMARLIDDILELSRVNRGKLAPEQVDLSAVARAIVERIEASAGERSGTVQWNIQDGLSARGDPSLLMLLLDNLLRNAWKYSEPSAAPRIEFGATMKNGQQVFWVRDNGIGFEPEYARTIFGVFQRLHSSDQFEGTGIGLATVERVVARHRGRAWAESKPGAGATFFFTLEENAPAAATSADRSS